MKIKSFGCSFIYGSDLPDCPHGINENHPWPSRMTWPALLAQRQGLPYDCFAWPGCGNLKILERILQQAHIDEPSIFVISWTWIDRLDYITQPQWPWQNCTWQSIMPGDRTTFATEYFARYHAQPKDQLQSIVYAMHAIDLLDRMGIPFVMTLTDDLLLESLGQPHAGLQSYQDQIRQRVTWFDGQTFMRWSQDQGFDFSANLHPLEQAHRAAADMMQPLFHNIYNKIADGLK